MNKRRKDSKKSVKNSPVLFEDEEIGTSSSDEVKVIKSSSTPKSHTGHSTPVRSKAELSDIPDLSYTESPIEQLTQHPPNEVGWDYHRPFTKEENCKSTFTAGLNHTPKRNVLLSKKRNSNSPLLYKPLKKKLHEEQKEDVAGFMEELEAIATNLKMNGERTSENPKKTEDEVESQLVVELDSQQLDESDLKLQISNNTDESPRQNNVSKNNYAALLNDSLENVMVLCSQEVEKEYNKKKSPLGMNTYQDKASSKISPDSSLEKMIKNLSKENVQPVYENEKSNESSSKFSPVSKGESCSSEIPDDSFDQFFTEIDDKEFCKNTEINIGDNSAKVKSYAKMTTVSTTSKNSTISNKFFHTKIAASTSSKPQSTVFNNHESQSITVSIQNKIINSNANFGYLNKGYVKNDSSGFGSQASSNDSDKSSETRFLKAKSFSGSNLYMQNSNTNKSFMNHNSRSVSHLNVNVVKGEQNVNLFSISENKGWRRTNSGSSIGQSSTNNSQSSVNRFGSSGSQTHFTPEEIERKRLEALSRREAKKKYNNLTMTATHNKIKR